MKQLTFLNAIKPTFKTEHFYICMDMYTHANTVKSADRERINLSNGFRYINDRLEIDRDGRKSKIAKI